jgi:hypothetical protein
MPSACIWAAWALENPATLPVKHGLACIAAALKGEKGEEGVRPASQIIAFRCNRIDMEVATVYSDHERMRRVLHESCTACTSVTPMIEQL